MSDHDSTLIYRALHELGLVSLYHCAPDIKILCLQRFVRLFAYGASTLVLVAYLQALDISKTAIGLFMTLTLVGDVAISFVLTLFADALGRKAVLALGAALMAASGVVFALCENYWVLLAAAVFGVISPSGNEIGPFRAIEESVVAHLTTPANRGDVYAWYSLSGTAGMAFGMMMCGWAVHAVTASAATGVSWPAWHGWPLVEAYRAVFYVYAAFGIVKLILAWLLSAAVEVDEPLQSRAAPPKGTPSTSTNGRAGGNTEVTPLLRDDDGDDYDEANEDAVNGNVTPASATTKQSKSRGSICSHLPGFSAESRSVVFSLCTLFALDAFASGLAPLSWVTFFFRYQYGLEEGKLGSVFFVTSIIAAASMIVASSLAKRFGNVNTMVFTHLPSGIFLSLIPVYNNVHWSLLFLVLRSCTQSMDVAPRSAFLAAIVLPQERTAVMGLINVVKTTSQSIGPFVTGALADNRLFWVSFVCAGSLKACYDLGMLALFKNHEKNEAAKQRQINEGRRVTDEEAVGGQ